MALLDSGAHAPMGTLSLGAGAEDLYRMGLNYSTGNSEALDLVQAHMFFNLAAMRGSEAAKRCRKELSEQMTTSQIAAAQRAAREWLAGQGRMH